jgi:hypothetical protein
MEKYPETECLALESQQWLADNRVIVLAGYS